MEETISHQFREVRAAREGAGFVKGEM